MINKRIEVSLASLRKGKFFSDVKPTEKKNMFSKLYYFHYLVNFSSVSSILVIYNIDIFLIKLYSTCNPSDSSYIFHQAFIRPLSTQIENS